MAQGPSDTILVITLRIRESKVRNPDPPDWQRFVLSEHSFLVVITTIISASISINIASISTNGVDLLPSSSVNLYVCVCVLVGRSVCLSVWKVYCGKTADWIWMLFGMVSGVGQGMGVLNGGGDRQRRMTILG